MIAVTGATGFLGINLVKELLSLGKEVLALDISDFPPAKKAVFCDSEKRRLEFVQCDIREEKPLRGIFNAHRIDAVVHAGAVTVLGEEDATKARLVLEVNAMGTLNLLEAARVGDICRFVYVSSSGIYGSFGRGVIPVHETIPYSSWGLYVAAKIYSELMCQRFNDFAPYQVVIGRIGSPYGPWERPTSTRKNMSMLYKMVHMGFTGEEARIWGYDSTRDWTHMRDIARGIALLATCDQKTMNHIVYNVTTGENVSTGYIAECIVKVTPHFKYCFVDSAEEANVIARLPNPRGPLDITRLRHDCGFEPIFDIGTGLKDYAQWIHNYELR